MHRRDFIRVLGGGTILAATAACAPAGTDPRAAWVNPGAGETDIRRKALSWAILAPNPHNMQPWLVELSVPGEITLYIDRTRLLPVTDPFNRQIVIGCGAFLELLMLALTVQGHAATADVFPDGEPRPLLDDRPLFRVRIARATTTPDPLFAQAPQRRTDRGTYADKPIPAAAIAALNASVPAGPAVLTVETAPARVAMLRDLVYRGAEIEAQTPAAHRESVERTFIGTRDVAAHPWGISLDNPMMSALNMAGILTKAKMETPGTTAYSEALKFLKVAAETSRGFTWIVTPDDSRTSQILAGRAYVRTNLAATGQGLAMHPWSQGLQEYATQKPVFDALHRELAPNGGRIQMLSRLGYSKAPVPPAPRRGLAAQLKRI